MLLTLLGWSKIISSVVDAVCFVDTITYALLQIVRLELRPTYRSRSASRRYSYAKYYDFGEILGAKQGGLNLHLWVDGKGG